jgi:hypothetical protein
MTVVRIAIPSAFCWNVIVSNNRRPPRIKTAAGYFRIALWRRRIAIAGGRDISVRASAFL